jgi:ribose 5-phosphate isomerase B
MHNIFIGSDHAGFILKNAIIQHLSSKGYSLSDLGCRDETSVDYPDYAALVVQHMLDDINSIGILICGSGIGMSIAANRNSHIRAGLCHTIEAAQLARKHNNCNVLALGARFLEIEEALKIVDAFLATEFEGGRHQRRVEKLHIL